MRLRLWSLVVACLLLASPGRAQTLVQSAEGLADSATSVALAYGSNVTAGNRLIVIVSRFTVATTDPFVAGDLTKTAGTATIGTVALDAEDTNSTDASNQVNVGIFSVAVTGTGSLTLGVAGNTGNYWWINVTEWSGLADAAAEDSAVATGTSTAASSGDATTAGAGLFIAAVASNAPEAVTLTKDAAFTDLHEEEDGSAHAVGASAYRIVASGTTDAGTFTLGASHEWAAAIAAYDAEGEALPQPTPQLPLLGVGE